MPTIRFESGPPDAVYEVRCAASYARAVVDAQEGIDSQVGAKTGCLVAVDDALQDWVPAGGVDIAYPLTTAAIYNQWRKVYNCARESKCPVLRVVR